MAWPAIPKQQREGGPLPNLRDYEETRAAFSWREARRELDGLPAGRGLNIAHEAVDRHAAGPDGDRIALRSIGKHGDRRNLTYTALRDLTNRFANCLAGLGVGPGDRVYALMGRIPELYVAALGTLKNRSVFCPLFAAFGPEPIQARMSIGEARVLVTTESLFRRKVEPIRSSLTSLEPIVIVDGEQRPKGMVGTHDYHRLMEAADDEFEIGPTDPEDVALLHFTRGTTGKPKGAVHVHEAVLVHQATGQLALDMHPEDIFWCTADPGWVTGTSYKAMAENSATLIAADSVTVTF